MTYKISEISDIIGGGTPKTTVPCYWNGDIPWISVKDIREGSKYVEKTEKSITEEGLKNSSTKLLSENDIVISARGTVGEIAMIKKTMAFNQSCFGIHPHATLVDPDYLFYFLKNAVRILKKAANGSVFDTITSHIFGEISIDLPSLDEQKAVSRLLSDLDDKITQNNKINDNLSKQAEAIFEAAFADSMYGDKKISDFILPKRGKSLLSKDATAGDVPVVAGGLEPATFHNAANTVAPVITISASGANAGFVRLWNVPVWSSDSSFIDKTMTDIVYFWYLALKTRQDEIYGAQTGSAQPHVYPQNVSSLPIGELDQVKAKEVNSLLTPLFEKIGENELENQKLASLRDSLLPRLLSGEINPAE